MQRPIVLVVDDDLSINRLLWCTLTEAGFEVLTADHGATALDILDERLPDAIVLDLQMPVMDGRTFYRTLRERGRDEGRDIPVLIMSAHGARAARRDLGANGALEKPFDANRLISSLRDLIGERNSSADGKSHQATR